MNDHDRLTRLTERVAQYDEARRLQATEYERRLAELNHAHQQAVEKERDFLQRNWVSAVFDVYVREQAAREERAAEALRLEVAVSTTAENSRLAALEKRVDRQAGALVVLIPVAGVLGAAITKAIFG